MGLTGQVHVVEEPALAAEQAQILDARDRLPDSEATHRDPRLLRADCPDCTG
jgi:hypothetical protein